MSDTATPRFSPAALPADLRNGPAWATAAVVIGVVGLSQLSAWVNQGVPAFTPSAAAPQSATRLAAAAAAVPLPPSPESDPTALVQVSAEDALARNAAIPVTAGANPAASAFRLSQSDVDQMRSIDCLAAALYYEAGLESADGQRAVAQVILNRVRHPFYPNTVCGVVFQGHTRVTGCQFTFTCDGSLRRTPNLGLFARSRALAEAALGGYVHRPVGWATHYHANYVLPYWAPTLAKVATIGAHIFYRWDGGFSRGRFATRYAGGEPAISWRGGFGQSPRDVTAATAAVSGAAVGARDAAAAAAAAQAQAAQPQHSVDSFQRAVLRRYETTGRERATQVLQEQARTQPQTDSNRWSLTGQSSTRPQQPLGRPNAAEPAQPVELEGVRRRPGTEPAGNTTEAR